MKRHWSNALFYILLSSFCLLLLEIGNTYDFRKDLSINQQNSLHASSVALLQNLQGPLALTAFVPDYPVSRADIKNLVSKYAQIYPQTKLEFIDPSSHPDMTRRLGIRQLGEMLVEYNGRQEKLEQIDEAGLTNAIARLSLDNRHWIVSISGHGEASLYEEANFDLSDFNHMLSQKGYKSIEHQVHATGQIPENTAMLLLAAPRTMLSNTEVEVLLAFLEQGGNLLWLADNELPVRLAEYLELKFLPGIIVDAAAADLGIDTPTIGVISQYPDHPVTETLQGPVLLPHARAMQHQPQSTGWKAVPLLQTGARSWNETANLQGTIQRHPGQGEIAGPLTLGYALTRTNSQNQEQRVVIIGDADFLSNTYLGNGANLSLGQSVMHWLTVNDHLVSVPEREAGGQRLHWPATTFAMVALVYLFLVPLVLLASGLFIYWRRTRA